jgi:predicted MFS family arabinose efflux permease
MPARRERRLLWVLAAIRFTHVVDFMVPKPLGPRLTTLLRITDARSGLPVSA